MEFVNRPRRQHHSSLHCSLPLAIYTILHTQSLNAVMILPIKALKRPRAKYTAPIVNQPETPTCVRPAVGSAGNQLELLQPGASLTDSLAMLRYGGTVLRPCHGTPPTPLSFYRISHALRAVAKPWQVSGREAQWVRSSNPIFVSSSVQGYCN